MSDEKTEEPTEEKLRKAREEGQFPKSQDTVVAVSTLTGVAMLMFLGDDVLARMRAVVDIALGFADERLEPEELMGRAWDMAIQAVQAIAPFVVAAIVGAVVGLATHAGFQITPKAVEPKFDQLNPAQGIKKVFSMRSVFMLVQMVFKAVLIGAVLWVVAEHLLPLISGASYQSPSSIGEIAWRVLVRLLLVGAVVFLVFAPLDFALQRHFFMKGQKMSKDEVKREYKEQDGDPETKGRRRELGREMASQAPAKAMARADALVVNPTHFAVAIRYRADEAGVPVVLAKGVDEAAMQLRGLAEAAGVPIFANPPLARALHEVPLDHAVPEALFEAVAAVLRWVGEIGAARGTEAGRDAAS